MHPMYQFYQYQQNVREADQYILYITITDRNRNTLWLFHMEYVLSMFSSISVLVCMRFFQTDEIKSNISPALLTVNSRVVWFLWQPVWSPH